MYAYLKISLKHPYGDFLHSSQVRTFPCIKHGYHGHQYKDCFVLEYLGLVLGDRREQTVFVHLTEFHKFHLDGKWQSLNHWISGLKPFDTDFVCDILSYVSHRPLLPVRCPAHELQLVLHVIQIEDVDVREHADTFQILFEHFECCCVGNFIRKVKRAEKFQIPLPKQIF